jgi:CRP-like cAMP-binding protein
MRFIEAFDTVICFTNDHIVKQGEDANAFFVLQSGEVSVMEADDSGAQQLACRLYEGHHFGQYW